MISKNKKFLSTIPEIIKEAKQGKMFILVDDEDRENEGDLVIPAGMCDDKQVNFMAKYGRGLICLALDEDRVNKLGLPLMALDNGSRHRTAFTVSIEAREGISTGISAGDRAKTIADAINPKKGKEAIVSPGHIFPLKAQEGGVLVRAGHTEASVDIAKLAGLNPSGVICEIMNDDGSMARMPDLILFAERHNLKIATIADLIEYRRYNEKLVERVGQNVIDSEFGGKFKVIIYKNKVDGSEHLALIKGKINSKKPVMVRMHHLNLFDDMLGEKKNSKNGILQKAMQKIAKNENGVIIIIRRAGEPLVNLVSSVKLLKAKPEKELRHYGIGAQILLDLNIKDMILLTNSKKSVIGLEGYGLTITEYRKL